MAYKKRVIGRKTLQKGEFVRKSDNRYCYKYKNENTGKFSVIYADTLEELRAKEQTVKEMLEKGINFTLAKKATLNECFNQAIELKLKEKTIRPQTAANYKNMWDNDVAEFGTALAADITPFSIRSLLAEFSEQSLSKSTIKLLCGLISSAIDVAISNKSRSDNPMEDKTVKKAMKNCGVDAVEKEALTPEEQKRLLEFTKNSKVYNAYYDFLVVALNTGLRVGELTGLTWNDIDMQDCKLEVVKQLRYGKRDKEEDSHFYIEVPKTEAGFRTVYFGEETKTAFHDIKQVSFALGKIQKEVEVDGVKGFVFLNNKGFPYATNAVNSFLKNIVDAHNKKNPSSTLPHISAHILRHSYATRAVEHGMNYKALQSALGHSKIGVTMDTYAKPNDTEWKREEMLKIQGKM